ncbi:MAG: methyltransferase domain-containing protein [Thermodesulfovibrio sp.]
MRSIRFYFDKASTTYENAGKIQKKVALELAKRIKEGHYSTVVEIGSGTGFLSIPLTKKLTFDRFIHIDISFDFLEKLKAKMGSKNFFINANAENIPIKKMKTDLLLGSSVLHWLSNPEENLLEILKLVKEGGKFYFSIFTSNTLKEIKEVSQITGFGSVYSLMPWNFYISLFRESGFSLKYELKTYIEKYPSPKDLLLFHKLTGTNYTENKKFCGKEAFKKFCKVYEKFYGNSEGVYATYEVLFIEGQRLSPFLQD